MSYRMVRVKGGVRCWPRVDGAPPADGGAVSCNARKVMRAFGDPWRWRGGIVPAGFAQTLDRHGDQARLGCGADRWMRG